ncbi:putative sensor-like histidine kinase YedV [Pseudodesulfovibrio hydrargyri]|uniref:histidine kinase n=1 Tax=Pseudodesulfovibrio hydrargyri TaxID=2125990 RepID=A0A1J5MSH6_9BACT|nr:ATP-binding protein [Pseudodesulfovibrio hydrargyri]OIQ49549.1 putative sensor-like histidine kinase YedV [Pseudodesulfovibrio hydrargyri]
MNDLDKDHDLSNDSLLDLTDDERMAFIVERIEAKFLDYDGYDFSRRQLLALNIFFELSQELRGREMFYTVCMAIPQALFGLESVMYILEDEETFSLAACSTGKCDKDTTLPWSEFMNERLTIRGEYMHIPIRGNPDYNDMLSFEPPHNVLGSFVMHPCSGLPGHARLFLEKYVNRVGYQLHHRIIRARNREHIAFIKSMVQDIGHNVIVPNMYYKLYFNRLRRKIEQLHLSTSSILAKVNEDATPELVGEGNRLAEIAGGIEAQYQEIYSHYESTSMFLETLLRRRHFEEGRYVLEKRDVNLPTAVVAPVVERFRHRFEENGIQLILIGECTENQVIRLVLDRGLISQVLDNLLSNALKYTEPAPDGEGGEEKCVTYGWKVMADFFGPGRPGIRVWVTSSGVPLDLDEPMDVFKPGFRADNVAHKAGTGRGLYFVRQVVELHNGRVSYAPTEEGNEFSFVLPFEQA